MSIQGPTSGGTYFPPSDFTVNTPGTPAGEKPPLGAIAQPPSPPVSDGIETNPDHPPPGAGAPPGDVRAALANLSSDQVQADMYALMALMQQLAQQQRNSAREMRNSEMQAQISSAALMADHAANQVQKAWLRGENLTPAERAEVAISVFEAKVIAHRCTLFATQEMFDVVGSRGTHADLGFDRFWRNVRTHTLHDPLDYKLQALGRWAVYDEEPSALNYN